MNSLISFLSTSLNYTLIPSLHLSCPLLTCALISAIVVFVVIGDLCGILKCAIDMSA